MDYTLELIVVPVSDVDRAKKFYIEQAGLRTARRHAAPGPDFRVVQLDPPGSACRSRSGPASGRWPRAHSTGCTSSSATSRPRATSWSSRGTEVGDIFHFGEAGQTPGVDPERRSYATFMPFQDPDGNTWLVQEVKRDWKVQVVKLDEVAA